jgi:hypothetical protein
MQRLRRGSILCFGSTIDGEFCVDTVFVVASAEPWVPAQTADLDVDDAFKICTGGSITTRRRDIHSFADSVPRSHARRSSRGHVQLRPGTSRRRG